MRIISNEHRRMFAAAFAPQNQDPAAQFVGDVFREGLDALVDVGLVG
ncbi:hypothetical protein [Allonocardiopsis opalescens]|nr:hypothetical protein [Allonocardiopsis opalescens]